VKITYLNPGQPGRDLVYPSVYMVDLLNSLGFELVDEGESDLILVTMSDPDSFSSLRAIRNRNQNAKIIVGGFEAYAGEWMLAFADYVVAGKGERFLLTLARTREIPVDLPEVYSLATVYWRACVPYEGTPVEDFPVITVGEKSMYGVAGFGCKSKCAFCLTSWVQPHRDASESHVKRMANYAEASDKRITFVTNDYDLFKYGRAVNAQSVMVRDILSDEDAFLKMLAESRRGMLHIGVEGFLEKTRRKLAKPLKAEQLRRVLDMIGYSNFDVEVFFISGIPGDGQIEDIEDMFPMGTTRSPRIFLKFTTLNPAPHTPLWTTPLDSIGELTDEDVLEWYKRFCMKRNPRLRTFAVRTPARELWRSVLRRCDPEQVFKIPLMPKANTPVAEFLDDVVACGLENTIDVTGRELPNSHIISPLRGVLNKAIEKWNHPAAVLREVRFE